MNLKYDSILGRVRENDAQPEKWGIHTDNTGSTTLDRSGNSFYEFTKLWLPGVALVLLNDSLEETAILATPANPTISGSAVLDGTAGQVMVRIPKIYYREVFDVNGVLTDVEVSAQPRIGFRLHEKFSYGNGRNEIYIGAYEASLATGDKLASVSGVATLTSVTLANFRTYAGNRGAGWHGFDFYTMHLIQLLFYVYYANFDSQTALPGYTEHTWDYSYKRNTGRSNVLTTINGSVNSTAGGVDADLEGGWFGSSRVIANRFLFIENIFGHIWKMLDGYTFDGRVIGANSVFATPNPALFSSDPTTILANYANLNVALPAASNENYMQNLQGLFLPKTHGGSSSTYITDYFWSYLDNAEYNYFRLVLSGGSLAYGAQAGLASRYAHLVLGLAYSDIGSRLCAEKI